MPGQHSSHPHPTQSWLQVLALLPGPESPSLGRGPGLRTQTLSWICSSQPVAPAWLDAGVAASPCKEQAVQGKLRQEAPEGSRCLGSGEGNREAPGARAPGSFGGPTSVSPANPGVRGAGRPLPVLGREPRRPTYSPGAEASFNPLTASQCGPIPGGCWDSGTETPWQLIQSHQQFEFLAEPTQSGTSCSHLIKARSTAPLAAISTRSALERLQTQRCPRGAFPGGPPAPGAGTGPGPRQD